MSGSLLHNTLVTQIASRKGFAYQQFVADLLYTTHGADAFTNLREVRDGGCDGLLIREQCAIACYGPGKVSLTSDSKKISSDYQKYRARWSAEFPNWRLFINHEPGPAHFALVTGLHGPGDIVWGLSRQVELITQLNCGLRRKICRLLAIPDDLVARDFVQMVLDDLISGRAHGDVIHYADKAPNLERKIRANYSLEEVDAAIMKARLTLEQQADVAQAIANLTTSDAGVLKVRILNDFSTAPGATFGERMQMLTNLFAARYNVGSDDEIQGYIHALLIHVFGQCLFGTEPGPEV